MMDWSDRHCRYFWRQLTRHALLYTEMITTGALLHGDNPARFLRHDNAEHPLALQLGGSDPTALARCAEMAQAAGFDEVNLNCGCPSDRVSAGRFGAVLMAEPELVAQCVAAMRAACDIPVTVKHRIGIDDMDSWEDMLRFVETVAGAGCTTFIVHARKAWLTGLSPKENRDIPPLQYDLVYRLKQTLPELEIILNGGLQSARAAYAHLAQVDGVMLGRAAYQQPRTLLDVDHIYYGAAPQEKSAAQIVDTMQTYIVRELADGARLHQITRHMLGLVNGQPGARAFRRHLSVHANRDDAGFHTLREALPAA